MAKRPTRRGTRSGVTAIAAGGSHTVALKNDGSVVAWGNNSVTVENGALSRRLSGVTAIAAGQDHTVALNNEYGGRLGTQRLRQTTVPVST